VHMIKFPIILLALTINLMLHGQDGLPAGKSMGFVGFVIAGTAQGGRLEFEFSSMQAVSKVVVQTNAQDTLDEIVVNLRDAFRLVLPDATVSRDAETVLISGHGDLGVAAYKSLDPGIEGLPPLSNLDAKPGPDGIRLSWMSSNSPKMDHVIVCRNAQVVAILSKTDTTFLDELGYEKTRPVQAKFHTYEVYGIGCIPLKYVEVPFLAGLRSPMLRIVAGNPFFRP
jgi:hypothetical protein